MVTAEGVQKLVQTMDAATGGGPPDWMHSPEYQTLKRLWCWIPKDVRKAAKENDLHFEVYGPVVIDLARKKLTFEVSKRMVSSDEAEREIADLQSRVRELRFWGLPVRINEALEPGAVRVVADGEVLFGEAVR